MKKRKELKLRRNFYADRVLSINWTNLALKSVENAFDAISEVIGTEKAGRIVGRNPKGDRTYHIDKVAEAAYLNNFPDGVAIISEESEPQPKGSAVIFLDPVCGSIFAKRGSRYFTTGIAVYTPQLKPICEAIGIFDTGDIYHADSRGAFKNGRKIHTSDKKSIDDTTIVNFESHMPKDRDEIRDKKIFTEASNMFSPGSNKISICMVSEGIIDGFACAAEVYPSTETIGTFMVRKAGGIVSDITGNKIILYPDLKHKTSMLCSCTKEMHASLLKML